MGKSEAKRKFLRLSEKDQILCIQATKNYANSKDVKSGIGIRDPHRFIRSANGEERWREYITFEVRPKPTEDHIPTQIERERNVDDMNKGVPIGLTDAMNKAMADIKRRSNK